MSDLTDRLRGLYVQNGTNYVQEAADEIDRLRVTVNMLQDDKAALRETQAKFGQVQHDLLSQIDALREQLALAESVRASQVAGLTEGAERLRERVKALEHERDDARASQSRCIEMLTRIYALIDPPLIEYEGKTYKFINPHAAEALHKLSNRIRAIPDAIDAALKGEA